MTISYKLSYKDFSFLPLAIFHTLCNVSPITNINIILCHKDQPNSENFWFCHDNGHTICFKIIDDVTEQYVGFSKWPWLIAILEFEFDIYTEENPLCNILIH